MADIAWEKKRVYSQVVEGGTVHPDLLYSRCSNMLDSTAASMMYMGAGMADTIASFAGIFKNPAATANIGADSWLSALSLCDTLFSTALSVIKMTVPSVFARRLAADIGWFALAETKYALIVARINKLRSMSKDRQINYVRMDSQKIEVLGHNMNIDVGDTIIDVYKIPTTMWGVNPTDPTKMSPKVKAALNGASIAKGKVYETLFKKNMDTVKARAKTKYSLKKDAIEVKVPAFTGTATQKFEVAVGKKTKLKLEAEKITVSGSTLEEEMKTVSLKAKQVTAKLKSQLKIESVNMKLGGKALSVDGKVVAFK